MMSGVRGLGRGEGRQKAAAVSGRGSELRLRRASLLVLAVLVGLSGAAAWVTHVVVRDQERRLLSERTSEVGLALNSSVTTIPSSLTAVGRILDATGGSLVAFTQEAGEDVAAGPGQLSFALIRHTADGDVVVAAAGRGLAVGQAVAGPRADTVAEALGSTLMVATPVLGTGAGRTLGFAIGPPVAPAGTVIYRESALGPVSVPRQAGTAPFHEVQVVLYAAPRVDPSQVLVTTTSHLPLRGVVRYQPFAAGASHWLLGVAAGHPLVGSVTADAPWAALAAGLIGAVLVAYVVDQAARRRDAALGLYRSERRLAETLQRSLLPDLPVIAGLDVASRYVAGQADQQVGGDWFDVFEVGAGKVGIVIGDVIGHDIEAAAAMSQVRAALRAYAWPGAAPASILNQLDQFVASFDTAALVTVFYGLLDEPDADGARLLRFANAGHLRPLVQTPDGAVEELQATDSIVIGVSMGQERSEATRDLPAGSTLLLFTDGLVEGPGRSLNDALEELATVVGGHQPGSANDLCERVLGVVPAERLRDDIAILAVKVLSRQGATSEPADESRSPAARRHGASDRSA